MTRVANDVTNPVMPKATVRTNGRGSGQKDEFTYMMGQAAGMTDGAKKGGTDALEIRTSDHKQAYEKNKKTSDVNAKEPKEALADKTDALQTKEKAVGKELAEKLGVSEEELEEAMTSLGFCFADLADAANMIALMGELSEGLDNVTVMMDENMFSQVNDLTQFVAGALDEIAEEFGVTTEELTTFMSVMDKLQEADPESAYTVEVTQTATKEVQENVPEKAQKETGGQQGQEHAQQGALTGNTQGQIVYDTPIETAVLQETSFTETSRVQEILDQIADYVKVNATPEITEMEIQLSPASLGTVNLQVAAKDGVITAQLIAQEEAVRQALELQTQALKESLQQQGIRVEAVEVTIASHEFEQNLEQDADPNPEEEAYAKSLRKGTRRLHLGELGEEDLNEMSEAELIQIDMMNRTGNRVDFMA
ncbi:MAG: hypothetical protein E7294_00065 [Lachnospiraceae bacterium]|jgi:flagellar hook-length control protein FliK|nr:hypothetical protein [Lachnospiraceae bacterium]